MRERTFFFFLLDIIFNNPLVRTITAFVNFCNEYGDFSSKNLKFLKKMPLSNNIVQNDYYKKRFVFTSITDKRKNSE